MPKKTKELVVLSLGGSIMVPDEVNVRFLKRFKKLIIQRIKEGQRFVIVVGGGKLARNYQGAADKISKLTSDDLDWLGIHATRLNAHLLRTIFRDYAYPVINKNPNNIIDFKEDILIASGWRPGCSTDYDAVLLAKGYGAKTIINMSNIDYVYDMDPRKSSKAKPLPKLNWKDFRKIVGNKWDPGSNAPFDPIASQQAEKLGLKVIILNGTNLTNFSNCLNDKGFKGTVIDS